MAAPVDAQLVATLDAQLEADLAEGGRLGRVRRYLAGEHDEPYMPKTATREYRALAKKAVTNWLPLVSDTYAKGLFVDGYRAPKSSSDAAAWAYWQANGLDARQSVLHRGALDYGVAYELVLPGTVATRRVPVMRPLSPLRSLALYRDVDDEFPEVGFRRIGTTAAGARLVELYDNENRYTWAMPRGEGEWKLSATDPHGLGVTPFVRFRERLGDESPGVISPLIQLQDRINDVVFSTLIAMQYASFRQRWVTGLAIPEDENGEPMEPFQAAVDRLWIAEDDGVRFGDFAQTDIQGHLSFYDHSVRTLAAIAQVSPNVLTGDLVNVGEGALAQLQDATQRRLSEYETTLSESHESAFRLAAAAAGDSAAAGDFDAQVRWRDTEARSLAATVDALGKLAQMLEVPVEGLWEKVPGVTDQDVAYWRSLRESQDTSLAGVMKALGNAAPASSDTEGVAAEEVA